MVTVTLGQGKLKGGQCKTDSGFEYFEFLGIPYAKPPVGELRFKSPQTPEPWQGVRDASTSDPNAISCQLGLPAGTTKGSEDCLYLNVYTPKLPTSNLKLKAVMVFFHGGGFVAGSGLKSETGPDYLIESDVVVVTVNYRLGLLGFLNLKIPEAAGNMGLKDQNKALQWIQNNIVTFGGDNDNVTIFGSSSGSASCECHILSSLSKGLFHKCILQSGSSLNSWAFNNTKNIIKMAVKVAQNLGYTGSQNDMYDVYNELLKASAPELILLAMQIVGQENYRGLYFGFIPSVEKDFGNGEAFLTETPYKILKGGSFNQVPVIRGFCNKEGTLVQAMKPKAIKDLVENKSFTDYGKYAFTKDDTAKYNTKLKTAYIDNSKEPEEFAINFFGDWNIAAGIYVAGKMQCKKVTVYLYKFCYDGKLNKFKTFFKLTQKGAGHSDETGYILRHVGLSSQIPSDDDLLMRSRLIKMWTSFAKTGNPTPDNCSDLPVQWPLFTEDSKEYLNINKNITIEANYEPEKIAIFEEILAKYEQ